MAMEYVGTRKTRDAQYTPAANNGMLKAAEREMRRLSTPQRIGKDFWERNLGFREDYGHLSNGTTPWATLRVMMVRDADEGAGVGKWFVRLRAGFVHVNKFTKDPAGYIRKYGRPIVSQRRPARLRHKDCLTMVPRPVSIVDKNDQVWLET